MVAEDLDVAAILVQQKRQVGQGVGKGLQLGLAAHQGLRGGFALLVGAADQGQQHQRDQADDAHVDEVDLLLGVGLFLEHRLPFGAGLGGRLVHGFHGGQQSRGWHGVRLRQALLQQLLGVLQSAQQGLQGVSHGRGWRLQQLRGGLNGLVQRGLYPLVAGGNSPLQQLLGQPLAAQRFQPGLGQQGVESVTAVLQLAPAHVRPGHEGHANGRQRRHRQCQRTKTAEGGHGQGVGAGFGWRGGDGGRAHIGRQRGRTGQLR